MRSSSGQLILQQVDRYAKRFSQSLRLQRVIGWALLSFGFFAVVIDLLRGIEVNQPGVLIFLFGIFFLARGFRLLDLSDSKQRLLQSRFRDASKSASRMLHRLSLPRTYRVKKNILPPIPLISTLIGGSLLIAAPFLVLAQAFTTIAVLLAVAVSAAFLAVLVTRSRPIWLSLAVLAATACLLLSLYVITPDTIEGILVTFVNIGYYLSVLYAIAISKQTEGNRRLFPALAILATTTFITLYISVSSQLPDAAFTIAVLAGVVLSSSFALLAWHKHGRDSFAKYLLGIATALLLFIMYQFISPELLVLIWLMIGVISLTIGVRLPSYSARLVGMLALAAAVLHYILGVLDEPQIPIANDLASPRLWVGIALAATLAVAGWWFQESAVMRGREKRLLDLLGPIARVIGAAVLLSAFLTSADALIRLFGTALWVILISLWASRRKSARGIAASLGVGFIMLATLAVIDAGSYASWVMNAAYVASAFAIVVALATLIWNHIIRNYSHHE